MFAGPSKLRTASLCHDDSRQHTCINNGMRFEPALHIGIQGNREACFLECCCELSKTWCHATIFFPQRRVYKGGVMGISDDLSLSRSSYGWKAEEHAMGFEHLQSLHAIRIIEHEQYGGNLVIGGKNRQDGRKLVQPHRHDDDIIAISRSQMINERNLCCRTMSSRCIFKHNTLRPQ